MNELIPRSTSERRQAAIDQIELRAKNHAIIMRACYDQLFAAGFTEEQAFALVLEINRQKVADTLK